MAGYRRQRTVFNLTFEEYEGLQVQVRSLPIGKLKKVGELENLKGLSDRKMTGNDLALIEKFFGLFAEALITWTLEDEDGTPIPPTFEAIMEEEPDFMAEIALAWLDQLIGVDEELGKDSPSGQRFPEVSLPTEVLSPSPLNSARPN
jgi:hypothetical protein